VIRPAIASFVFAASVLAAACATGAGQAPTDSWVDDMGITAVGPRLVLPGTAIVVSGSGFVHPDYGQTWLHLVGTGEGGSVDILAPAERVDEHTLRVVVGAELLARLRAAGGTFDGGVRVETEHDAAGVRTASNPLPYRFDLRASLEPGAIVEADREIHVNQEIPVRGEGLLLGGAEGQTVARLWGCHFRDGEPGCAAVEPVEIPITPADPLDRTFGRFAFSPVIAGVRPGTFRGTVRLVNAHGALGGGARLEGADSTFEVRVLPPVVTDVSPAEASLGQYMEIAGGGFVTADDEQVTVFELSGRFRSDASGSERAVEVLLVPEHRSGESARYVLSEDDELGQTVSLRREHGTLTGTIRPVVRYRSEEARGAASPFAMRIAPLRQVVYLSFEASFVESLRHFGLRALDARIRERILEAAAEPYGSVGVELRTELPTDYALYAHVDVAGPDPNGQGLFGYDNTPGKDVNNLRLHDRIGGINAATQMDGFPGYGGIFVESLMGFSLHPGGHADSLPSATDLFDIVFDPFRPDRGGRPVDLEDVRAGFPELRDARGCPAASGNRPMQIACAVWVLGNLVGGTIAHEVGHSLGLANPEGDGYHDAGDRPNRLMDAGGARPFEERAQLLGSGPGIFCDEAFEYLRELMPTDDEDLAGHRPGC